MVTQQRRRPSPGVVIRECLLGQRPILNYERRLETVTEASPTDLHRTYKHAVRQAVGGTTVGGRMPRAMTYSSFLKTFNFAKRMGLVEFADEEESRVADKLYTATTEGTLVPARRRLYRLTDQGRDLTDPWERLSTANREFVAGAAPSRPARRAAPARPPRQKAPAPAATPPKPPSPPARPATPAPKPRRGAQVEQLTPAERISDTEDRLRRLKTRNSANAERALDALEEAGIDVSDARDALDSYRDLQRTDYDTPSDYFEERAQTWEEFLDAVGELEPPDEEEGEEEVEEVEVKAPKRSRRFPEYEPPRKFAPHHVPRLIEHLSTLAQIDVEQKRPELLVAEQQSLVTILTTIIIPQAEGEYRAYKRGEAPLADELKALDARVTAIRTARDAIRTFDWNAAMDALASYPA